MLKKIISFIAGFFSGIAAVLLYFFGRRNRTTRDTTRIGDCEQRITDEVGRTKRTAGDIDQLASREGELIARAKQILNKKQD